MPLAAYAIIALLIASIGAGVVWTYNHAITKAERLEGENKALQANLNDQITENAQIRMRAAQVDSLLAQRRAQQTAAADIERRVTDAVQNVVANNQQARDWWTTTIPTGLVDSVRLTASDKLTKDNPRDAAAKPASASGGP